MTSNSLLLFRIYKQHDKKVLLFSIFTNLQSGEVNTLRPRQKGRHFADDIFKCIFLNENVWIPIKISLKFVPLGPLSNIPVLVQIMGWRRPGDKLLSGPMMVRLPTRICVTRPQWVNTYTHTHIYIYIQLFICTYITVFQLQINRRFGTVAL